MCGLLAACQGAPPIPPHKIVSDNPCIDAILHDVAAPEQIGAISAYSRDPAASSVPLIWARRYPTVSSTAEEIIAARPSLYITSAPIRPETQAVVTAAEIKTLALPVPNSIAESIMQVREVAHAIGRDAAGEALVARINAAARAPGTSPRALIYQSGGLMLGTGTLADDELRAAGMRNAARDYSDKPWDVVPLEMLILRPPDIVLARTAPRGVDLAKMHLKVVQYDPQLTYCGAGTIPRALARLRQVAGR
ncbi:MAG: ABC transporter substrate-binding protein [Alphaproteobacteria bacterium]|nr:ABC transporter substrate-binding protein [Alphaproteobacteria bacterium]